MSLKLNIIELLKKESNQLLVNFFLQSIDSMGETDLNDLYFLLTLKDKDQIESFVQKKSEDLQGQVFELEKMAFQMKKMTLQHQEDGHRNSDHTMAENLLNHL